MIDPTLQIKALRPNKVKGRNSVLSHSVTPTDHLILRRQAPVGQVLWVPQSVGPRRTHTPARISLGMSPHE